MMTDPYKAGLRSSAILLLTPALLLLAAAHLFPGSLRSGWTVWGLAVLAALVAVAALLTSRWPPRVQLGVGLVYVASMAALFPYLGLLAVCSTGDCL